MNKSKIAAIINLILCTAMISLNAVAGSKGLFGNTVGDISNQLGNFFTPAGYAFSIWSIIFLSQLILAVYLLNEVFRKNSSRHDKTLKYYVKIHLANMLWIICWHSFEIAISVVVMLLLLFYLTTLFLNNKRRNQKGILKWSTDLYFGWIAVATVANITAFLVKIEWNALFFSEQLWAVIMVCAACILYLTMVLKEKLWVFGLVGVWALLAIAVKQSGEVSSIFYTAIIATILISISVIFTLFKVATK